MENLKDVIRYDEQVILKLRSLYSGYGYTQYKMSRFEEYELYTANRAFLPDGDIITFTGASGKLMALRPDVTLSIIKNAKNDRNLGKLYYNENVYRTINGELKEQMQVGLEYIGLADTKQVAEILALAKKSLDTLGDNTQLDISHMGFLRGLLKSEKLTAKQQEDLMQGISERNTSSLSKICESASCDNKFKESIISLASLYGLFSEIKSNLEQMCVNEEMRTALDELTELDSVFEKSCEGIKINFSVINDIKYYNGVVFQGFIEGISENVLSGGRYDEIAKSFGKCDGAIGFAVNLDLAMRLAADKTDTARHQESIKQLGVALPKGRLGEKAYEIFNKAGFECPDMNDDSRKLIFENKEKNIRYFLVKPSDVAIYVEQGVADIGVIGKDSLLEDSPDVYELLDLNIGKCRMCVAAPNIPQEEALPEQPAHQVNLTLRVGTKFPNIARTYYTSCGQDIDVIKLHGSVELSPLIGLSDVIVDLVETGKTLEDNNMKVTELIAEISARLISNKASYRFKHKEISELCEKITVQIVR